MRTLGVGAKSARVSSPLPVAMRCAGSLAFALLATGLASCSSMGVSEIAPAKVAPDQYQSMTCERMKSELRTLNARKADLAPALFPSISEQEREHQLAQVNGELQALSQVSADKCSTR